MEVNIPDEVEFYYVEPAGPKLGAAYRYLCFRHAVKRAMEGHDDVRIKLVDYAATCSVCHAMELDSQA